MLGGGLKLARVGAHSAAGTCLSNQRGVIGMTISEASIVVDVPAFLTVDEAARAGDRPDVGLPSAREFLATDGASGISTVRVGRQLRVPRWALELLTGARLDATSDGEKDHGFPPASCVRREGRPSDARPCDDVGVRRSITICRRAEVADEIGRAHV